MTQTFRRRIYDPRAIDRHPQVTFVCGLPRHGKSTFMQQVLATWPKDELGLTLAVDDCCADEPVRGGKYIAGWADRWCRPEWLRLNNPLPLEVGLVACDEMSKVTLNEGSRNDWKPMRDIIFRGQHSGLWLPNKERRGVSALLGLQTLTDANTISVWKAATRVIIFCIRNKSDLERIETLDGMRGSPAMDMIPRLPVGHFIEWDQFGGIDYPEIPLWRELDKGAR